MVAISETAEKLDDVENGAAATASEAFVHDDTHRGSRSELFKTSLARLQSTNDVSFSFFFLCGPPRSRVAAGPSEWLGL
jgi:hypothetical protein